MAKEKQNKSNAKDISKLSKKELIEQARKFSEQYCVGDGDKFRLEDYKTNVNFDLGPEDKPLVRKTLESGVDALADMQDILYAQDKWSLLLIFQAMDAAGKDGAIKHVMKGVNPQGCQVFSFKAPSAEDMDHDFMWRCQKTFTGTWANRNFWFFKIRDLLPYFLSNIITVVSHQQKFVSVSGSRSFYKAQWHYCYLITHAEKE